MRWRLPGDGRCASTTVPCNAVLLGLDQCRGAGRADTLVRIVEIGVTVADIAVYGGPLRHAPIDTGHPKPGLSQVGTPGSSQ
jgi:hypothetical protein